MKKDYKKISEKKIKLRDTFSGYDKDVLLKCFRLPNGIIENFYIDDNKSSVEILPVASDGSIITVKQYRPGLEEYCIELPGGGLEDDENPHEAAERELQEETGYNGNLHFLGKRSYSPYSTGLRYMYVADNCDKIDKLDLDENEFLQVVKWPFPKFRDLMRNCKLRGIDCAYLGLDMLGLL